MSEEKQCTHWDLNDVSQLSKIAACITEGMNLKYARMIPRGFDGKVEFVSFAEDDFAFVAMSGTDASGKPARLRYRLKLEPQTESWVIKSFVDLSDSGCAQNCPKDCILHSQFSNIGYFEEAIVEYIKTRCDKAPRFSRVAIRTAYGTNVTDVHVYDADSPKGEEGGCFYRLKRNDNDCWKVSDWKCPKKS